MYEYDEAVNDLIDIYRELCKITGAIDDRLDLDGETELTEAREAELQAEADNLEDEISWYCSLNGLDEGEVRDQLYDERCGRGLYVGARG